VDAWAGISFNESVRPTLGVVKWPRRSPQRIGFRWHFCMGAQGASCPKTAVPGPGVRDNATPCAGCGCAGLVRSRPGQSEEDEERGELRKQSSAENTEANALRARELAAAAAAAGQAVRGVAEDDLPSVRARPGRSRALGVPHSTSLLDGAFLWPRGALNGPKRWFLARE
jgi:hypothetical protein